MILRYSRDILFRCFSRLSSNWRQFLFNYRLAFSFFFILVLPLPLIFLRVTHSKVVLHLFISFLSNLRVRFLRDVHSIRSLFPPLFVIVFLSLIYLRFIFPLLVRFFYIYTCLGIANRIPVWQTGWYFGKEESLPKIVRTQLPLSIRLSFEDVLLFWNTWLINTAVRIYAVYNFINKFDKIYYYSRCIRKRLNRENCKKKRKEKNS